MSRLPVGGGEGIRMQDISGSRAVGCTFDGVGRDQAHISGSNVQVANNHFSGMNTANSNSYFQLLITVATVLLWAVPCAFLCRTNKLRLTTL